MNISTVRTYKNVLVTVATNNGLRHNLTCDYLMIFQPPRSGYDAYAELYYGVINSWTINGSRVCPKTYARITYQPEGTWKIVKSHENQIQGYYQGQMNNNNPVCLCCYLVKV